jgi:hypothetical protein
VFRVPGEVVGFEAKKWTAVNGMDVLAFAQPNACLLPCVSVDTRLRLSAKLGKAARHGMSWLRCVSIISFFFSSSYSSSFPWSFSFVTDSHGEVGGSGNRVVGIEVFDRRHRIASDGCDHST